MRRQDAGLFVLTFAQCVVGGQVCTPEVRFLPGDTFLWEGEPTRLDGPNAALLLSGAIGQDGMRRRARRRLRRLLDLEAGRFGMADVAEAQPALIDDRLPGSVILSDGPNRHELMPIRAGRHMLFWCATGLPQQGRRYRILHGPEGDETPQLKTADDTRVICFAQGALIDTEEGARAVEDLRPGTQIATADDGLQPLLWVGAKRMSGARLRAMPDLRPIRIRAGALGHDHPQPDLLVSPSHRVLIRGAQARALFNEDEVLVTARDLVNDRTITRDLHLREVVYHHLLLPRHAILWANGVESESFHPAEAPLEGIEADQREGLFDLMPELRARPESYGSTARRLMTQAEAAILTFGQRAKLS